MPVVGAVHCIITGSRDVQQCGQYRQGNLSRELLDALDLWARFLYAPLLKAEIDWHRLVHDLIGDFDAEALARRQASPLEAAGLDAPG
jgi:hypothetical protein